MTLASTIRALHPELAVLDREQLAGRDPGWNADNLNAGAMVMPSSTEQVCAVLSWCNENGVSVVPQGGRTGLVGGTVTSGDQLILSTSKLNAIESINVADATLTVQSGVTLQDAQAAAAAHGLHPGIDLAARGTATIGGMIATNAGGIKAFRFGVMRHRILGLEAVMADGSVLNSLTGVVKDNTGYDIKHLLIGSEGTLGVVTRAVLKLEPVRAYTATALVGVPDVSAALAIARGVEGTQTLGLEAAEIIFAGFARMNAQSNGIDIGTLGESPCILVLEVAGPGYDEAHSMLTDYLAERWEQAGIIDAVVAGSVEQRDRFWTLREDTHTVYRLFPSAPSYDISVPSSMIDSYLEATLPRLTALGFTPFVFGHIADGNLHIILDRQGPLEPAMSENVETALYDRLSELGGSFSAEHGIGSKRLAPYNTYVGAAKRNINARIKQLLDPRNILNPGKLTVTGFTPTSIRPE